MGRWGVNSLTVEVRRANEGDVDAEVAVVGRAVQAEVDAKGDRGPGRVLLVAVKAYLHAFRQWKSPSGHAENRTVGDTLFAGFAFNFSNILMDSCFGAREVMVAIRRGSARGRKHRLG